MAIHRPVTEPGIYYITFTCYKWLPLIEMTLGYDLVYNWFDTLSAKEHTITGFVIMPNHLHLLLHFSGGTKSLNTVVGNGKRFMAYEIIKRLEKQHEWDLLNRLHLAVRASDKRRGQKHEVWKDGFDVKQCRTEKFILQKLHYIHNNPCAGKWRLVTSSELYQHSSVLFYLNGDKSNYPRIRDYREFLYPYQ